MKVTGSREDEIVGQNHPAESRAVSGHRFATSRKCFRQRFMKPRVDLPCLTLKRACALVGSSLCKGSTQRPDTCARVEQSDVLADKRVEHTCNEASDDALRHVLTQCGLVLFGCGLSDGATAIVDGTEVEHTP